MTGTELTFPSQPKLDLDPFLAGYVLAMPAVHGGRACLHGTLAHNGLEWDAFQEMSHQAGLELEVMADRVQSRCDQIQASTLHVDCSLVPKFFPLALALAVAAKGESVISVDSGQDMDFAVHILSAMGMESEQRTARELKVRPVRGRQQEGLVVTAPNAFWCLGLALMALTGADVRIKNPGALTSLWPQFWSLYKELPRPRANVVSKAGKQEEEDDAPKRRRRIVK
jgi:5-enolpyruvylshikimate-3-phosphate synthase